MDRLATIFFLTVFILACSDQKVLPSKTGALNEVVLVADQHIWESSVGDSIRATMQEDIPGIAWKEPLFDLVHITANQYSRIFQTHRNLIVIEKGTQSGMSIEKNVNAQGQLFVLIQYKKTEDLQQLITQYMPVFSQRIQQEELSRLSRKIVLADHHNFIRSKHQLSVSIPKDFHLVLDTNAFSWYEYSPKTQEIIKGYFIYNIPYNSIAFNSAYLLASRDSVLSRYVKGEHPNSYMTTEQLFSPSIRYKVNDDPIIEIKGMWKMENAFMGGSFISNFYLDSVNQQISVVEGFLFNPSQDKRNDLQRLEVVLQDAKIWRSKQ